MGLFGSPKADRKFDEQYRPVHKFIRIHENGHTLWKKTDLADCSVEYLIDSGIVEHPANGAIEKIGQNEFVVKYFSQFDNRTEHKPIETCLVSWLLGYQAKSKTNGSEKQMLNTKNSQESSNKDVSRMVENLQIEVDLPELKYKRINCPYCGKMVYQQTLKDNVVVNIEVFEDCEHVILSHTEKFDRFFASDFVSKDANWRIGSAMLKAEIIKRHNKVVELVNNDAKVCEILYYSEPLNAVGLKVKAIEDERGYKTTYMFLSLFYNPNEIAEAMIASEVNQNE